MSLVIRLAVSYFSRKIMQINKEKLMKKSRTKYGLTYLIGLREAKSLKGFNNIYKPEKHLKTCKKRE